MTATQKLKRSRLLLVILALGIAVALAVPFLGSKQRNFSDYEYEIIRTMHHETNAFTQGLLIHDGVMYESTGQHGESSLRKLDLQTGEVLQQVNLDRSYFGEGLAYRDGKLYQLTYRKGTLLIYDASTFEQIDQKSYSGEGWGLTYDGKHFIMSNGSAELTFRDPESFEVVRRVQVYHRGHRVFNLNELEYVDGKILANIYTTKDIVVIDPAKGTVEKRFVFRNLPRADERTGREDVLNGVAYNPATDLFYITGKYWSRMYELKLIAKKDAR